METRDLINFAVRETQTLARSFASDDFRAALSRCYDRATQAIVEKYQFALLDGCAQEKCRCRRVGSSELLLRDGDGMLMLNEKEHPIAVKRGSLGYSNTVRVLVPGIQYTENFLGVDIETAHNIWSHAYDLYKPVYWHFFGRNSFDGDVSDIADDIHREYGELYEAIIPQHEPQSINTLTEKRKETTETPVLQGLIA